MHHVDVHENGLVQAELTLLGKRYELFGYLKLALVARTVDLSVLFDWLDRFRYERVEDKVLQEFLQEHVGLDQLRLLLVWGHAGVHVSGQGAHLIAYFFDDVLHCWEYGCDVAFFVVKGR